MTTAGRRTRKDGKVDFDSLFDRLQTSVDSQFSTDNVPEWIEKNTFIQGKPFNFKGHEYQLRILASRKPEKFVKKCSQLGISELQVRIALAYSYMIPHFSTIMTLPNASFAATFSKTRIDPVIRDSTLLREALDGGNDSAELKQIGTSLLYIRGTFTQSAAISVPADMLIHDEVDFSDQAALTSFQSRLTHSEYKWIMKTSTPTVPNYGIDDEFKSSNRYVNFCKCDRCGHQFIPNYRTDIVIPGFDGDIMQLDKRRLPKERWRDAYLQCPKCKKKPDLSLAHREWVCENDDEQHTADGFQISPFDAPTFITVQNLLQSRTRYKRISDFVNFSLGQCDEDELSGIQPIDLEQMRLMFMPGLVGKVLGVDMGVTCHIVEAAIDAGVKLMVVKLHRVNYKDFRVYFAQLMKEVRPIAVVIDSQPYVETVHATQVLYQNVYGSVYVNAKGLRAYRLMDEEEDKGEALLDERQVNVNRNVALDFLMEDIRAGEIGIDPMLPEEDLEEFDDHMRDMRRIRTVAPGNNPDTERFVWVKSKGEMDHWHHALLYAWVAARLRLAARPTIMLPSFGVMTRLKLKLPL